MKNKKGISLIVLIITIIVVIILASVVILTLSKNNPIESAKEARFKEDVRTFQDELALYISKQYANAGGHWDGSISAKSYNEIVEYIPSFTKKYEGKFIINNNNLEYTNKLDEKEKEYAQSLNVKEKIKLLPDEYQQVEYIESTGTQWIDTKVKNDINFGYIESKFQITTLINNRYFIFGCYSINDSNRIQFSFSNPYFIGIGSNTSYTDTLNNTMFGTNITNVKLTTTQCFVNNELIYTGNGYVDNNNAVNIYMFARNAYGTSVGYISKDTRIYLFCIYNNEYVEVRNFIPCYSTTTVIDVNGKSCPNGTIGMYDTVEGKFYTNQGTGEDFIPGPDVD